MAEQSTPIIVQPGMGKELHAFGNVLSVMLSGGQTRGILSVMSELIPPDGARRCMSTVMKMRYSWFQRGGSVTLWMANGMKLVSVGWFTCRRAPCIVIVMLGYIKPPLDPYGSVRF